MPQADGRRSRRGALRPLLAFAGHEARLSFHLPLEGGQGPHGEGRSAPWRERRPSARAMTRRMQSFLPLVSRRPTRAPARRAGPWRGADWAPASLAGVSALLVALLSGRQPLKRGAACSATMAMAVKPLAAPLLQHGDALFGHADARVGAGFGAVPDVDEDARAGLGAAPRRIVDHQARLRPGTADMSSVLFTRRGELLVDDPAVEERGRVVDAEAACPAAASCSR